MSAQISKTTAVSTSEWPAKHWLGGRHSPRPRRARRLHPIDDRRQVAGDRVHRPRADRSQRNSVMGRSWRCSRAEGLSHDGPLWVDNTQPGRRSDKPHRRVLGTRHFRHWAGLSAGIAHPCGARSSAHWKRSRPGRGGFARDLGADSPIWSHPCRRPSLNDARIVQTDSLGGSSQPKALAASSNEATA